MKRHLCVWIPHWPLQRLAAAQPELRDRPLVLLRAHRGRDMVVTCCRAAHAAGARAGMPVAEARALLGDGSQHSLHARFLPDDPPANREALRKLAWDCETFSPLVGLEEGEDPSSLLVDISGAAACFRGEPNLVSQVLQAMQECGYQARVGVADTLGTAWAVSHFRTRSQPGGWGRALASPQRWGLPLVDPSHPSQSSAIVPSGQDEQALSRLPIEALRLPPPTVRKLHDLDIRRISQLRALPRASLPSRFGPELLKRLDQALGKCPELIVPEQRPLPLREVWDSESPLRHPEAVEVIVTTLVEKLVHQLNERGEGVLKLRCELWAAGVLADELSVSLLQPTVDARHVMELWRLQWERLPLPADLTRIVAEITEWAALLTVEQRLWDTGDQDHQPDTVALLEKLTSRLSRDAVLRPVLQAEQQPERAYRYEPLIEGTKSGRANLLGRARLPPSRSGVAIAAQQELRPPVERFRLSRPLWLKGTPVPVQVLSIVPGGPPYRIIWEGHDYRIIQCWGPERITTGWWRGEHVRRDYYQTETTEGHRFWLFRDWMKQHWFLHAVFE